MYQYLHEILKDHKGETVFACFGSWHILYMAIIFGTIIGILAGFRNKGDYVRRRVIRSTISAAFCLYIADFFLMPFAYGSIDLEKLPFHMCTMMCVLGFFSTYGILFPRHRRRFALLGLVSNLIYVIYPAGVGWYQIHPISYRVVQTMLFHGLMSAYGIFVLAFDEKTLSWKDVWKDIWVIACVVLWAMLGNWLYNGSGGMLAAFNWFFVVRDPFYILPADIAQYIMPVVMIVVIFVADVLIRGLYIAIRKLHQ